MHGAKGIGLLLFLIVAALAAGHYLNAKRIYWLPGCGATILIGAAAGLLIYTLSDQHEADFLEFDPETFTLFLLPPIIFEAGYHLNMRLFRRKLSSILSLAVIGTIVATGITWFALLNYAKPPQSTWEGFDVAEAGQFAALISAVDPVASLAVFGALRVDHELQVVVLGESVLNDAIALIAFRAIGQYGSTLHTESKSVIASFCTIALGSLVTGTALGALAALSLKVMKIGRSKEVRIPTIPRDGEGRTSGVSRDLNHLNHLNHLCAPRPAAHDVTRLDPLASHAFAHALPRPPPRLHPLSPFRCPKWRPLPTPLPPYPPTPLSLQVPQLEASPYPPDPP